MAMVSPPLPSMAVIRRALEEFKLPSYDDQILQIQDYIKILLTWNDKLNLTAIRDPLDFACARALGEYPVFLNWAHSGHVAAKDVVLWIGSQDLPEILKVPTWEWREPIPVPNSLRRLLLVGRRNP